MIVLAAVKRGDKIYTGKRHCEIISDMVHNHGCKPPIRQDEQGFTDDKGEFHNRHVSRNLAKRSGQLNWDHKRVLLSEDLW